jgi:SAM-dependent methyltransferase
VPSCSDQRITRGAGNRLKRIIPLTLRRWVKRFDKTAQPAFGKVDFGDFHRTRPISCYFGFDRGTPIDRYYIERFLAAHSADIKGRALEIGDATYCRRFGGERVTAQDVLDISPEAPGATIVGDLSHAGLLPEGAFDCLVVTQTLQLIYDMHAAVAEMFRGLRPGGVLLLTVPGISQLGRSEWGKTWFWSLTAHSAQCLFSEVFGADNVEVKAHGNVFAATAFLQGLAVEEVHEANLDFFDEAYPVIVTMRAQKPERK